ncbi:MAG: inosine triphosphate pyrophosphatase [bacterium]|jgi:inosine triphosphate pyrophosphatase
MKIQNLLLITGNQGKAKEFQELLTIEGLTIHYQSLDLHEIQSIDLLEVGRIKTEMAIKLCPDKEKYDAVLTDDTGLSCNALNGLPGPFIKFFLDSVKVQGILEMLKGKDNTTTAQCVLSLGLVKTGEVIQFEGNVLGELIEPRGEHGFGWDPSFLPKGEQQTYAEMSSEQKQLISHRALASQKLKEWIMQD